MTSNVPTFASFRPKPKGNAESSKPTEGPGKSGKRRTPDESKEEDSRTKPERREKRGRPDRPAREGSRTGLVRHEKREKHPKYSPERPKELARRSSPHVPVPNTTKSYFIDRKGDPDIVRYGSLNRYDTPAYRRFGRGSVMGLSAAFKIDWESSNDRVVLLIGPRSQRRERLLTSKHAGRGIHRNLRFIKANNISRFGQDGEKEEEEDFIRVSGKRKRDEEDEPHEAHYRDIESRTEKQSPADTDLEDDDESALDNGSAEITQKNSALVQKIRNKPQDLHALLDLVDHQEAMMLQGRSSDQLSGSDRQHLAEVRISMLEQSIRKLGNDDSAQIKLHLVLMTEASWAWAESKLGAKWSDVLSRYPSSPELWMKYLDHVQGDLTSFKYETCRATFHQCLKTLRSGTPPASPDTLLHILIRMTVMIRDAGYQELGLAIWQALLEFHLLSPGSTCARLPGQDSLQSFEEFWDSEVPRIGERNAKGWRGFQTSTFSSVAPSLDCMISDYRSIGEIENFQAREVEHMHQMFYPGRTTDDIGEDDPFHLVLYSDIEAYLQVLPRDTPLLLILEAFLCFMGMPPLPRLGSHRRSWSLDPFLQAQSLHSRELVGEKNSLDHTFLSFKDSRQHCEITMDLLFGHVFPKENLDSKIWTTKLNFVQQALKLLALSSSHREDVGEYLLAFEQHYYPSEAAKTAKALLKVEPTSLRLYNAYGLMESHRGNSQKADQVFSATLSMQTGLPPLSAPGSMQLFFNWCWEALRQDNRVEALWRMVSPHGRIPPSMAKHEMPHRTDSLRMRTILAEAKDRALLGQDYPIANLATSLLTLLVYLSNDQDLVSALAVHGDLIDWFVGHGLSQSTAAELHAQSVAQFLAFHATHTAIFKSALLRDNLEPLIERFPNNTYLLSLYAANESRFSIHDRVRGIMHQRLLQGRNNSSAVGWLFALNFEMKRGEIAGSTSHSVRALFRKAENDTGAHSPAIWKSHLLFELSEAEKERVRRPPTRFRKDRKGNKDETRLEEAYRRVKEVFYGGLKNLPWSKVFMMLAFTRLQGNVLTAEELTKVYHVMIEKELRIYVDVGIDS